MAHPGANRVQHHVPAHFQEVSLTLEEDRLVAPLEHVALAAVAFVERLRVDAVQEMQRCSEVPAWSLANDVVVIAQEAVGVHDDTVTFDRARERGEEAPTIGLVPNNPSSFVSARCHVIDSSRKLNPQRSCDRDTVELATPHAKMSAWDVLAGEQSRSGAMRQCKT